MRVALIHDALTVYGGAEKVLEELHAVFPSAPVFVPTYKPEKFPAHFHDWDIRPTWMNKVPGAASFHRQFFFLYPFAMHDINLEQYDLVLSSSFNFAHNVVTGLDTCHICYCHSPARFLWDFQSYAEQERFSKVKHGLIVPFLPPLRALDRSSAQSVNQWIATSGLVKRRIRKFYGRPSAIIPPPVNTREFHITRARGNYFLVLMRLVGWKRADIVIEACNALKLPLVVAGDGRELSTLKAIAGPTVEFAGRVDGEAKAELYANCSAFILPANEDFGITPIEAMASGRPVIALGKGGALDTILPGKTGEFFEMQTAKSLAAVLSRFDPDNYDPLEIRRHAQNFDSLQFRGRITDLVKNTLHRYRYGAPHFYDTRIDESAIAQDELFIH